MIKTGSRDPGFDENQVRRRHGGRSVLLVEDNLVNLEVAEELLVSVGLKVESAENGAVAIERVRAASYDVILMDVMMPVLDGIEATRRIRSLLGASCPPIIAMTASAFVEDRKRCLDAGMIDYIAKPVDPPVLFKTLLRWLPLHATAARERPSRATTTGELPILPDEVARRLRAVPGLEVETGLRNVGGRVDTLVRVLARFAEVYQRGVPLLLGPSAAVHREAWREACHSLGGACAAVGAVRLAQLAADIDDEELDERSDASLSESGLRLHGELITLTRDLMNCI
jgi:two-component system, sensor histidine kinase and response regulator